mmetsp:Transcript_5968/g.19322  ORF Transcript_5968/g.19322 Transcript_5968/m.19322 type:complete len:105 (+) Transcript_5968:10309-10623(+)
MSDARTRCRSRLFSWRTHTFENESNFQFVVGRGIVIVLERPTDRLNRTRLDCVASLTTWAVMLSASLARLGTFAMNAAGMEVLAQAFPVPAHLLQLDLVVVDEE